MTMEETAPATAAVRLPDPARLVASSSPHVHGGESIPRIMLLVIVALVPGMLAGVLCFGWRALAVLGCCAASAVLAEALVCRWSGRRQSVGDFSALLTGLLLGMNLSPLTPWWVCVIGAAVAIGIGKQVYGGLGYNPFNPALVGRVALLVAFPKLMTTWMAPAPFAFAADAVTTATPLGAWQMEPGTLSAGIGSLFLGNVPGCIGETSAAALLAGGLLLIALRLIQWQVPVAFIGTVALFTAIANRLAPGTVAPPLFHLFAGGLFLGAFFMATDMVTSPLTRLGGAVFGVGCGVITCVIRIWGGYPEGVSFAILIMNALTPLIDRATCRLRPFGARPEPRP
jgi:electron transport complex protein RnfD